MIPLKQDKYGDFYFEAEVTLPLKVYLKGPQIETQISEEQAMGLVKYELRSLAGSNDGSELLRNASQINFKA